MKQKTEPKVRMPNVTPGYDFWGNLATYLRRELTEKKHLNVKAVEFVPDRGCVLTACTLYVHFPDRTIGKHWPEMDNLVTFLSTVEAWVRGELE